MQTVSKETTGVLSEQLDVQLLRPCCSWHVQTSWWLSKHQQLHESRHDRRQQHLNHMPNCSSGYVYAKACRDVRCPCARTMYLMAIRKRQVFIFLACTDRCAVEQNNAVYYRSITCFHCCCIHCSCHGVCSCTRAPMTFPTDPCLSLISSSISSQIECLASKKQSLRLCDLLACPGNRGAGISRWLVGRALTKLTSEIIVTTSDIPFDSFDTCNFRMKWLRHRKR